MNGEIFILIRAILTYRTFVKVVVKSMFMKVSFVATFSQFPQTSNSKYEIEACCDNLNVLVVKLVDCICTSTTCTVMYLCGKYMTTLVVIICILN